MARKYALKLSCPAQENKHTVRLVRHINKLTSCQSFSLTIPSLIELTESVREVTESSR